MKLTRKLNLKSLYSFKRTTVRTLTVTPKYIRRQAIQGIPLVQLTVGQFLKASLF